MFNNQDKLNCNASDSNKSSQKAGSKDIYQIITDQIIKLLEKNIIPWKMPWNKSELSTQQNLITKKPYRGMNSFLLACSPFNSPYWVTFKQAKELGGHVRKDEHGTVIIFWKFIESQTETVINKTGKEEPKMIPLLRFYNVFNIDQIDGIDEKRIPKDPQIDDELDFEPIIKAEEIIDNYIDRPNIAYCGNNAFYRHSCDTITLPPQNKFISEENFYGTLFHEIVHSTGHVSRLDRFSGKNNHFASQDYSYEELVAEMGAAFLCSECHIIQETLENSAAYIQSWLKKLRNDKTMVVKAAGAAQKAIDLILNR